MKRPGVLLGILAGAVLLFITFNTVVSDKGGSAGLERGAALPPFAMPLSTSSCRGRCDANVATRFDQGAAGSRPACSVRGPEVLNSCALAAGGPFVLAFVFHPVSRCRAQLSVLEGVAARHPDVRFAVVAVRGSAADARGLGTTLPVGYDHDGAVANEYAVVVCPTITFVAADGHVEGSTVGSLSDAEVESWVKRIS